MPFLLSSLLSFEGAFSGVVNRLVQEDFPQTPNWHGGTRRPIYEALSFWKRA